jgi:hypothetical protein
MAQSYPVKQVAQDASQNKGEGYLGGKISTHYARQVRHHKDGGGRANRYKEQVLCLQYSEGRSLIMY